jgi:hypothetical protein
LAVKILIPFIILGSRPTSTPGPRRDQLGFWDQLGCSFVDETLPDFIKENAPIPKRKRKEQPERAPTSNRETAPKGANANLFVM